MSTYTVTIVEEPTTVIPVDGPGRFVDLADVKALSLTAAEIETKTGAQAKADAAESAAKAASDPSGTAAAAVASEATARAAADTTLQTNITAGLAAKQANLGVTLDTDVTLAANSDTRVPSQKAVKAAIANSGYSSLSAPYLSGVSVTLAGPLPKVGVRSFVAIDVGTVNCEIAKVTAVNGATLTLSAALTLTHSAGAAVAVLTSDEVPAWYFGIVGDSSTDDTAAWQQAVTQCAAFSLWLNGCLLTSILTGPLLVPDGGRIRHVAFQASAAFAPADTNNAMVMLYNPTPNGQVTWTAAANVVTTNVAHGLLAGKGVILKGTMPSGLVAGRQYYATSGTITTTAFQLSSTVALANAGTSDITFGTAAGGVAYLNPMGLGRIYTEDVYINCNQVAGVNGFALNVQQPAIQKKLRIDNAASGCWGMWLSGQQGIFENFESLHCDSAIMGEGAQFMWWYGFDIEQFVTRAVGELAASTYHSGSTAGINSWTCKGCHHEVTVGTPTAVWDLSQNGKNLDVDTIQLSWGPTSGAFIYAHTGGAVGGGAAASYIVRNLNGAFPGSTGFKIINDTDRGTSFDSWDDFRSTPPAEIIAPATARSTSYPGQAVIYVGTNGRYIKIGAQQPTSPTWDAAPDSTQTVDQAIWRDKSGSPAFGVSKDGHPKVSTKAVPLDADISASTFEWWWDDTAGAAVPRYKGKDSGGTVVTGALAGIPPSTVTAKGDLLVASASGAVTRLPAGSDGQVLVARAADTLGVGWESGAGATGPLIAAPRYIAGEWYGTPADTTGTASITASTLYLCPVFIAVGHTFQALGINIVVAGTTGTVFRLGIFADDGVSGPGTLILDAGTVAGDATGRKTKAISQLLNQGIYWVGCVAQSTGGTLPTVTRVLTPLVTNRWAIPQGNSGNFTAIPRGWSRAGVTGTLATVTTTAADFENTTSDVPQVWVQA